MITDEGIRFSGSEFMEVFNSTTELESKYNELKRKYDILQDFVIKLDYRIKMLEVKEN